MEEANPSNADFLVFLAYKGLPNDHRDYRDRLEYELEVIISKGYVDYFLVLWDIIKWGKKEGIRIGVRGSAGGSLVAYTLGVTTMDPIAFGLLFERFLNPERVSLPDIDVDVDDRRRAELIGYITQRFGADRVAQIMTLGTIGSKAALKDANRVLGGWYKNGERLVGLLPPMVRGRAPKLSEIDMSGLMTDEDSEVYGLALGLEGLVRQVGVHAAGVVISPVPIHDILPVWKRPADDTLVTGYTMEAVDALGLVKMDILGLRNLGVIDECLRMVRLSETELNDFTDVRAWDTISGGSTLGCFQVDSSGMRGLLRKVQPRTIYDLSAVLALFRPGPMDNNYHTEYADRVSGKIVVSYPHRDLESVLMECLAPTYGMIVFQEQLLEVLRVVGGYTYATAALIFDAMRKKDTKKLAAARPELTDRMKLKGYSYEVIEALWETLLPFADYSFNKAHATGYAILAYQTAYLKTHYPMEYMSALLTSVAGDPDRLQEYITETSRLGIPFLPPDINTSDEGFTTSSTGIRYGLAAIRGVGEKAFDALVKRRPYRNLTDFFKRADSKVLNVGVLSALIRSGSFDQLHANRGELLEDAGRLADLALDRRKKDSSGDRGLFVATYEPKHHSTDTGKDQYRQWEHETLGVELTHSFTTLVLTEPLSENEWIYLRKVLEANPGPGPVVVSFGRWHSVLRTGVTPSERLRKQMAPLKGVTMTES